LDFCLIQVSDMLQSGRVIVEKWSQVEIREAFRIVQNFLTDTGFQTRGARPFLVLLQKLPECRALGASEPGQ